jgi:predicted XRE-type DNA-binding protein
MPRLLHRPTTSLDPVLRSTPPLSPNASIGKRWRFRRNLVIYVAHRNGLSQRFLADVFDLPRSRISAIIREFQKYEYDRTDDPPG